MTDTPGGLIHAILLNGGGASDLVWSAVADWQPEQGCLWLHFDFEEAGAQAWIEHHSGLNEIAANGLLTPETRPRCATRGDNLLINLRGINLNPGAEPDDMVSIRIWTDGHRVISARKRRLQSTEDLLEALANGVGPRTAAELLVDWTDRIVAHMGGTVENLEEQVADLEERILEEKAVGLRQDLAQLRRQAVVLRRYLAPQREALSRLYAEPLTWLDELNRLRLREINDRLIRYIEDIDAARERAAMTQEELLSKVSEETNRRSYVFTVVATIFLPLGFFTGLMGINVGGMPGVEDGEAFWVVVGMCAALIAALTLLFRFKRWL